MARPVPEQGTRALFALPRLVVPRPAEPRRRLGVARVERDRPLVLGRGEIPLAQLRELVAAVHRAAMGAPTTERDEEREDPEGSS
jgi:hypothetical protein